MSLEKGPNVAMDGRRRLEAIMSIMRDGLQAEPTNPHDQFATAVIKPDGTVVSHIPKHASRAVLFSFRKVGSAGLCEITGNDWPWTENSVQLQVLLTSSLRRQALNSLIVAVQTTFYTDHYYRVAFNMHVCSSCWDRIVVTVIRIN